MIEEIFNVSTYVSTYQRNFVVRFASAVQFPHNRLWELVESFSSEMKRSQARKPLQQLFLAALTHHSHNLIEIDQAEIETYVDLGDSVTYDNLSQDIDFLTRRSIRLKKNFAFLTHNDSTGLRSLHSVTVVLLKEGGFSGRVGKEIIEFNYSELLPVEFIGNQAMEFAQLIEISHIAGVLTMRDISKIASSPTRDEKFLKTESIYAPVKDEDDAAGFMIQFIEKQDKDNFHEIFDSFRRDALFRSHVTHSFNGFNVLTLAVQNQFKALKMYTTYKEFPEGGMRSTLLLEPQCKALDPTVVGRKLRRLRGNEVKFRYEKAPGESKYHCGELVEFDDVYFLVKFDEASHKRFRFDRLRSFDGAETNTEAAQSFLFEVKRGSNDRFLEVMLKELG